MIELHFKCEKILCKEKEMIKVPDESDVSNVTIPVCQKHGQKMILRRTWAIEEKRAKELLERKKADDQSTCSQES